MNWILIAYLLALIFLATKLEDDARKSSFREAWIAFALIPFWHFIMHLFRAGNSRDPGSLQLIGIWEQAISSLLLGVSLYSLLGALVPSPATPEDESE